MNASTRIKWLGMFSLIVASWLLLALNVAAAEPVLDVVVGGQTRQFGRDELLRRPDVTRVTVANDIAYGKSMSYRAVPVSALLAGLNPPVDSVIESAALDGFAAQLPLDILTNTNPVNPIAWLAIEPADMPWPPLPGKAVSAGPFYIVWTGASVATIRSEQWPYQLAKLESQPSPLARWPALDVDPGLSATDPARAGLALFVTQCLACHTLNGAGASSFGPDLNQPMNPTEYLTLDGLRALIRNPKAVRTWPGLQMPGFAADQMTDSEIDQIIGYLKHMATRRGNSETRSGALPR
jgi:mono/diheme cytochrome c family protein